MWIDSEGTLKVEQREFGPQLRAPPFVAARKNVIMVLSYYAVKKKKCSRALDDSDSGRNLVSGKGKMPKQSHGVTVNTKDNIDGGNISSLIHNKVDGNRKEDTSLKAKISEEITVELNNTNETESDLEANNEEVCLAKEFGVATLLGSGKRATKNPSSRDNLSDLSQLKKSCDFLEARALHSETNRVALPRRERKTKSNTAGTY